MKTKKFFAIPVAVLVALVAVIGICGCSKTANGKFSVTNGEFEVNDTFLVARLNCDSADADWSYTIDGKGDIQMEGDELTEGKAADGTVVEGVVASHAFRFSGTGASEQTITFTYGADSGKTVTCKVVTNDKGSIQSVNVSDSEGAAGSLTAK